MATCYRHSSRETGVQCSNCGRPICPDCMTPTSVGMRCPECSRDRTRTRLGARAFARSDEPRVTYGLIGLNVVLFLAEAASGGTLGTGGALGNVADRLSLYGPDVASNDRFVQILPQIADQGAHQFYRLVTAGFLHQGLLHIAFNMFLLWLLGQMLEPALGSLRFGALYFAALLAGSLGALIASPLSPSLGASGAVFGLMGAAFVEQRRRGINPMQSGIGTLILFNLAFSLIQPGISIGAHVGGLVGGAMCGLALGASDRLRDRRLRLPVALGACLLVGVGSAVAAVAVANSIMLPGG